MKQYIKRMLKAIFGKKIRSLYRAYSSVPSVIVCEFYKIMSMVRYRRVYAEDPEVRLGGVRTRGHIVDKGLQISSWEVGRGALPYLQLCNEIEKIENSYVNTDPSYYWALQKKKDYEKSQLEDRRCLTELEKIPQTLIEKEQLLFLIKSRRTVREFKDATIENEILKELIETINWAPTSCNRQPAKVFFTQNPDKIAKCLMQCAGATCLGDAVPCFLTICADSRLYMIKDKDLPLIDVSLGLQNMLLMAHLQGIGGTILNWMHHTPEQEKILRQILNIPKYYSVITNLIIGYSSNLPPVPLRKGFNLTCQIIS